jgi:hypothetical protein
MRIATTESVSLCKRTKTDRVLWKWNRRFAVDTKGAADIWLRRRELNRKAKLSSCIMFAVIRHYHFNPKDGGEIDRRIREDFVPIVKKAKGFVRYYWLDTGEGVSVSVFKDEAGADESVRLAADYVQEHLSKFIIQKPEMIEGPIKAHD